MHHATAPEARALLHKEAGGQLDFFNIKERKEKPRWDFYKMAKASKEFQVPVSTEIFLFFPEIFDRDTFSATITQPFIYNSRDGILKTGPNNPGLACK